MGHPILLLEACEAANCPDSVVPLSGPRYLPDEVAVV